jgi:hypothetical protein
MHRTVVPAASALALSILLLLPAGAAAQTGSIAGEVADETGGVLPGVTVEASSPALIEGVRTAFTDGSGRYGLEALRPGTYTVTFVLPGFSTFVREGIEIATGFSANVDVTLTVGAVEETVTVSGASPIIDVQNVVHQENISNETLDILPTGRTYSGYAALTVGAQTDILGGGQDVGGSVGDTWGTVIIHGSATYDGEIMWDGMSVTASVTSGGGTGKMFFANQAAVEEVVMATGGMDAETGFGAIAMNYIPREGGNSFSFYGIATGANEHMQNLNYDQSLLARGLEERQIRGLKKNWDWGAGFGGPIVRDRLWFYTAHRWWGSQTYATGSYHNGAPRDLPYGAAFYEPDFDRPTEQESTTRDNSLRLTWQASQRNKITFSHADQGHCLCQFWSVYGTVDHNASLDYDYSDIRNTQASWTMPASNRLLFEAGVSLTRPAGSPKPQPEVMPNDVGVQIGSQGININALMWLGANTPAIYGTGNNFPNFTSRASMSYVTGSHNFKVGMTRTHVGENHPGSYIQGARSYVFSEPGVPLEVRQYATPMSSYQEAALLGIYAQDQWTVDRLTLNIGVRYDHLNGWVPEQTSPVGAYVPAVSTQRLDNFPNYRDLGARLGAAYDLFGDGRTALKWNSGRYVNAIGTILAQARNPLESIIRNTSRSWNDLNGDLIPNCDFGILHQANGECGAVVHPEFGTPTVTRSFAPGVLGGWNNRRANWQHSVGIQHELTPGLSVEVAYFRRNNSNYLVADNLNIGPEHFKEFSIIAPTDPVLGDVSGQTLGGLYTLTPEGVALGTNNQMIPAGDQMWETFNGVDFIFDGRLPNGITLAGGVATGAAEVHECFVIDNPMQNRDGYCNYAPSWADRTQYKFNGSVPLPYDMAFSFVFQSLPGERRFSNYTIARQREFVEQQLGYPLLETGLRVPLFPGGIGFWTDARGGTLTTSRYVDNSVQWEPQVTQIDLRLTKILRFGAGLIRANFDVFNILNANAVTRVIDTYTTPGDYPRVTGIMNGRLFKFGATIDF